MDFFTRTVLCTYFNFTHPRQSRGVAPSASPMIVHSVLSCQLSRQRWAEAYTARHSSLDKHCSSVMSASSECTNNQSKIVTAAGMVPYSDILRYSI